MKRFAIAVVSLVGLIVGGSYLVEALKSDEQKIQDLLVDMTEYFNEGRMLTFVECLADDYRETSRGIERGELQSYLFYLVQQSRNSGSNEFIFRAEIVDPPRITIAEDANSATVELSVRVDNLSRPESESSRAEGQASVRLEKRDGWQVTRTDFSGVKGRLRF